MRGGLTGPTEWAGMVAHPIARGRIYRRVEYLRSSLGFCDHITHNVAAEHSALLTSDEWNRPPDQSPFGAP
jgi:hypothetical protein